MQAYQILKVAGADVKQLLSMNACTPENFNEAREKGEDIFDGVGLGPVVKHYKKERRCNFKALLSLKTNVKMLQEKASLSWKRLTTKTSQMLLGNLLRRMLTATPPFRPFTIRARLHCWKRSRRRTIIGLSSPATRQSPPNASKNANKHSKLISEFLCACVCAKYECAYEWRRCGVVVY